MVCLWDQLIASTCQNTKMQLHYSYQAHYCCAASGAGELWGRWTVGQVNCGAGAGLSNDAEQGKWLAGLQVLLTLQMPNGWSFWSLKHKLAWAAWFHVSAAWILLSCDVLYITSGISMDGLECPTNWVLFTSPNVPPTEIVLILTDIVRQRII